MLELITKYLLQYKRVSIPQVGSFFIVSRMPEPDTVNGIMDAPVYITEFSENDHVAGHQFTYLAALANTDEDHVKKELSDLGSLLKAQATGQTFEWNGLGFLRCLDNKFVFEPNQIRVHGLTPVTARPVPVTTATIEEQEEAPPAKKGLPVWAIIAWIILLLGILFIVWVLYRHNWNIQSLGLSIKALIPSLKLFRY